VTNGGLANLADIIYIIIPCLVFRLLLRWDLADLLAQLDQQKSRIGASFF
jgi:hypothetical protein